MSLLSLRRNRVIQSPCEYQKEEIPEPILKIIGAGKIDEVLGATGLSLAPNREILILPKQPAPIQTSVAYELLYRGQVQQAMIEQDWTTTCHRPYRMYEVVLWNTEYEWLKRCGMLLSLGQIPRGEWIAAGDQSDPAHVHHFVQLPHGVADYQGHPETVYDIPEDPMLLKAVPGDIAFPTGTWNVLWDCGCGAKIITPLHGML